jgi:hypothetical protein
MTSQGSIICFRCRSPLGAGAGYCLQCGTAFSGQESDPDVISNERRFLLEQAEELSRIGAPTFCGFGEEELSWRAQRVPRLPRARPREVPAEPETREALMTRLSGGDMFERGAAALTLAEHQSPEVVFALLKHLSDRDSEVRACILWALGKSQNPLVVAPLLEFSKLETDERVRTQLAATLHRLVTRSQKPSPERAAKVEARLLEVEDKLLASDGGEFHIMRGKLHIRLGRLLNAIGDFSRCIDDEGRPTPHALLYRSQGFLLMGKPLFALDDLVLCPGDFDYPPIYYLHKAALLTLARQIVTSAREKGLNDYARLFERRLEHIADSEE